MLCFIFFYFFAPTSLPSFQNALLVVQQTVFIESEGGIYDYVTDSNVLSFFIYISTETEAFLFTTYQCLSSDQIAIIIMI